MKMQFVSGLLAVVMTGLCAVPPSMAEGTEPVSRISQNKVELLAFNRVLASFEGIEHKPCLFRTSLCPDKCGHARDVARFHVLRYFDYGSFGQYGDVPQETFFVNMKEGDREDPQLPVVLSCIRGLQKGDTVELSWAHLYVTQDGSSFPQRRVLGISPVVKRDASGS